MFKLQEKKAMSAYLLKCGLDDQDPEDWDNPDTLLKEGHTLDGLVIPDVDGLTSDEEAGEGKKGDEMEEDKEKEEEEEEVLAPSLRIPSPNMAVSSEEDEEVRRGGGEDGDDSGAGQG